MIKTGVREMRQNLTKYLERVQRGEEVIITRRDEPIAKLVPVPRKRTRRLASRKDLRVVIAPVGKPLSRTLLDIREERL